MASSATTTFTLNNNQYLLWSSKATLSTNLTARLDVSQSEFAPVTAIFWDQDSFNAQDLARVCHEYENTDDVWCGDFLSSVLLLQSSKLKCATSSKHVFHIDNSKANLPAGPLMVEKSSGQVYLVAKLQVDTHAAFVSGIVPTFKTKPTFQEFSRCERPMVPLPSRMYFPKDPHKPLNGVRVAVKDSIALKGLHTSYGSQAWLETYDAETFTAPCVQKILDAGAIVVGKCKTTEFAEGLDPCEYVGTICPYNPRGDGQQKPSSSSSGSAAAVAAYSWLDTALGTDTGGSIRHPAGVTGLFGQRPTTGCIDLKGVYGATDLFNTVGIFARSAHMFHSIGSVLCETSPKAPLVSRKRKFNLLYPTRAYPTKEIDAHHHGQHRWFPHPELDQSRWSNAEKQIEQVVLRMEEMLDCKRIPFNINELWRATPVIGQPRSLDEAVGPIYSAVTMFDALNNRIDQFYADYAAKNDGKQPPMAEVVKQRLDYGRTVTPKDIASSLKAMEAFREWTENTLFASHDQEATTIMVFPQSCGRPDYRDVVPKRTELFNDTFSIYAFGYLVGCPDYTIPVGEVPFTSEYTKQVEYLPTSISLVGRPGSDHELFDIVDLLHKNKAISDVMAGSRMFEQVSK